MTTVEQESLGVTQAEWLHCPTCRELVYAKRWNRNAGVCPECGAHGRLTARERIRQLVDPGTFREQIHRLPDTDPLGFTDRRPYPRRVEDARRDTGEREAVVCGAAAIDGRPLVLAVMDFRFLGGSLGTGVGELLTLAAEDALARRLPLLVVTASGGARMQEGVLSLLQMAKVSQAIAALNEAGLLFVSLITDPTYGGVAASFATQADVIIAEPGARLGFAGRRVIRDTVRAELPDGFQTAEFLLARGALDVVADRAELRDVLSRLLRAAGGPSAPPPTVPSGLIRDCRDLPERDPWHVVSLARNAERPTGREYTHLIAESFLELHGDRMGADSPTIIGGIADLGGISAMVVATQKGHSTRELLATNFGMAGPEGYRKALRLFRLAEKLGLPVVTLIDTPGAYPGVAAEENCQAGAIATNILALTGLRVPVIPVITGEGGSGGALALAVGDQVLMFANGVYSVISPEGCAAILWDATAAPRAAEALRITAPDLLRLGVVDGVIPEPGDGAHTDPTAAAANLAAAVRTTIGELGGIPADQLVARRRERLRRIGAPQWTEDVK
ncbi:acetyl-CoA carboxylase carboxyl transferase subunit beta [Herbihabitans rhizosphaerae]|uniref:Multifunctional fusion protein n=1 Tax=Herbihabitans rhizosphaerae TaxID=1872711 RepID=A0A4Q7KCX6_9PSEU|nr:acetyl-CoA carboxylase, carboxyltransferase subunit beta [Herbihabitans rhizosphaerae]RZS31175.1 acetyl-CoA carboxylase carboxyl transferase subunit beta [Herbihabitans rhizosphaerae]